ncbi:MAG: ATP-binding cassette domain-containing protein [Elusimicrobia bacterium]|mgnify:CR=1 FL=1|nr:ATP-binding cassette domain-containing protein [Elusimicrobiota bacterium]
MFKSNTGVPLLEFRNLSVARGDEDKFILRGIGIKMRQGEHIALLGPNGCGKSSFINLVTREYYPLSGVAGYSFKVLGREDWNVFDLRYLFGIVSDRLQSVCSRDVTGMETVLSGFFGSVGLYRARVTARMLARARAILDFLEIGHLAGREIPRMSTGEARLFLIARALVHDPRGLILDEPCNGLDLHATRRFRDTLRKIAGTGISVILATHNLHDIIPEIKRVVLMKEGGFIADGPKDKLLRSRPISRLFGLRLTIKKTGSYYYVLS